MYSKRRYLNDKTELLLNHFQLAIEDQFKREYPKNIKILKK